jgi:protocatechuate 3,4-dioxygenase beta subunit
VCSLAAQPPEKCAIQGRVVNAATGAPLKRATVWVEPFSPTRGANGTPSVSGPSATTDAEGRFSLDGVDPGSYLLSARRTGYLDQGYHAPEPEVVGPPVKLNPGETLGDVTLKLTPQSLLYGKVIDEDGEAVPEADVTVYRTSYGGGRKQFVPVAAAGSQADGSVVIGGLGPGRYYLGAFMAAAADPRAREAYVRTYYPATIDPAAASPVEVGAGAEVRGLAIRLHKSRVFHIRGRAIDAATGSPAGGLVLHLMPREAGLLPAVAKGATTARDGRFEFAGVLPGSYRIQSDASARFMMFDPRDGAPARPPQTLFARTVVGVTDSDVEDLPVPVAKGAEISGKLVGEVEEPTHVSVALLPSGSDQPGDLVARVDGDGTFRLHNIPPDSYEVAVGGLPGAAYVKTVTFGGQDYTNRDLDLTSGAGGTLELRLSPDAGEVTGTVRNAKGDPMPGALVQIWPAGGESAKSVKADDSGAFHFRSLPPADYRVAAWEDLDDDLAEYPAFRARFEAQAVPVTVAQRGRQQVEVKAIPREASAAEAAKLP